MEETVPEAKQTGVAGTKSGGSSRIPFNIYDFFGYIFPGAYTGLMILLISSKSNSRLGFLIHKANEIVYRSDSILSSILSATLLLIVAYSLGHIVATISHVAIDRLLVGGVLGYPFDRYLNKSIESPALDAKRSTSLYIFLTLFLMLVGPVLFYHFGVNDSLNTMDLQTFKLICYPRYYSCLGKILLVLLLLKAGHAFLASKPYNLKPATALENSGCKWILNFYASIGQWLLLPALNVIESFIGTDRKISPQLTEAFRNKFFGRFQLAADAIGTESYWLSFFHLNRKDGGSIPLLTNWLHIYSFARNMAAACFAILLYILYRLHTMSSGDRELLLVTYVLNFYLMVFFLLRYWMIYTTYYSKSIVRIFYTSASDSTTA